MSCTSRQSHRSRHRPCVRLGYCLGGVKKEISLALLDDVKVGDYVILHVGYALSKLDPDEAEKTLALFSEMNETNLAAL